MLYWFIGTLDADLVDGQRGRVTVSIDEVKACLKASYMLER